MKKIFFVSLILLIFCSGVFCANDNKALLDSANNEYAKNKFDNAISYYNKILKNGYESSEIYYNIGNAHYKEKRYALAILNYEKAKKISPTDDDIQYNLKLANAKLVDKIEVLPQLFIKEWWNGFLQIFGEKVWSFIFIILVWVGFTGLLIYFISKIRLLKQIGFITAIFAFLFSLVFFFVAQKSYYVTTCHTEGIILSLSVNIKGSPSEQGTNLFILHEGTKVNITQSDADWTEIKLPNGNRGWIRSDELGVI
jgi:hypothetical protein